MSKIEDWKVEDEGVIIGDKYSGHGFACGDKVVVKSVNKENGDLTVYNYDVGETRWVDVRDIEKDNMIVDEKEQFRICDILGVDVGQEFEVEYCGENNIVWINEEGCPFSKNKSYINPSSLVIHAINHPESIKICLNEKDIEYAKKIYDVFGRDGTIRRINRYGEDTLEFNGIAIKNIGFKNIKMGDGGITLSELIDIS